MLNFLLFVLMFVLAGEKNNTFRVRKRDIVVKLFS